MRFRSQQHFDLLHVGMSNACILKFFEIIQRGLAEGSLVVMKLGIFVFQINGFRFVELVIEEITVGKIGFDNHCVVWRELQSFEGKLRLPHGVSD